MLSREENELLTRVGPGTPMGRLMRRYWLPALLSEQCHDPPLDVRTWWCVMPSLEPAAYELAEYSSR